MYSYVEDHDLWRVRRCAIVSASARLTDIYVQHKLPFSKEFASGVASRKLEYSQPLNPHIFDQLLKLGTTSLRESRH